MKSITLHDRVFVPYIKYEELSEKIDAVAEKLNADFKDCEDVPVLLCIMNGSLMFVSELMKRLDFNIELASMKLSSYSGTDSTGHVSLISGPTCNLENRVVIVCEDIVDTGNTMVMLDRFLHEDQKVKEMRICTMLLKPEMYHKNVKLDYVALEIPNKFIVGFGLDFDELGRNLKDIYVIKD